MLIILGNTYYILISITVCQAKDQALSGLDNFFTSEDIHRNNIITHN